MERPPKNVSSQWLHGFLDLCLLGLLRSSRDYGYGLSQRLAEAGFDDVPGGTLYPALLRLERQSLVAVTWQASASGPRRKYYDLTDEGRRVLLEQAGDWERFSRSIDIVTGRSIGAVEMTDTGTAIATDTGRVPTVDGSSGGGS